MGQPLQLTVEKLVYGGHGLGRIPSPDADEARARVVLVPLVLPGEEVTAEPVDRLHARLLTVREASPVRVAPPCPYFGVCGGCHYQHMPYEVQVEQKKLILREVLERTGKLRDLPEIEAATGEPWQYRNRTQLHVRDGAIGYLRMGTHELCAIDHCPISSPSINDAIRVLTTLVRDRQWPSFIRRIELFSNEKHLQFNVLETERPVAKRFFEWVAEALPRYHAGAISYAVGGEHYRISPRSFFQVNRFLVDAMVQHVIRDVTEALDLYAGAGLFSVPLARRGAHVTAVESSGSGAADLRENARAAGVGVNVVRAEVGEYLLSQDRAPDFVVADPPREGLGKSVVRELLRLAPRHIALVACDPATLGRDLRTLTDGGYRINKLTLIDLFPQTYHIETVAELLHD